MCYYWMKFIIDASRSRKMINGCQSWFVNDFFDISDNYCAHLYSIFAAYVQRYRSRAGWAHRRGHFLHVAWVTESCLRKASIEILIASNIALKMPLTTKEYAFATTTSFENNLAWVRRKNEKINPMKGIVECNVPPMQKKVIFNVKAAWCDLLASDEPCVTKDVSCLSSPSLLIASAGAAPYLIVSYMQDKIIHYTRIQQQKICSCTHQLLWLVDEIKTVSN